jgi:hypothetical protein
VDVEGEGGLRVSHVSQSDMTTVKKMKEPPRYQRGDCGMGQDIAGWIGRMHALTVQESRRENTEN